MKNLVKSGMVVVLLASVAQVFAINGPVSKSLPTTKVVSTEGVFVVQEEIAQFPGGDMALNEFVKDHINYPTIAKTQGIEGTVVISMIIDENGSAGGFEIIKGIGGGCEEEVIKALEMMPKWKPTNQSGHQIKTKRIFSFTFQL